MTGRWRLPLPLARPADGSRAPSGADHPKGWAARSAARLVPDEQMPAGLAPQPQLADGRGDAGVVVVVVVVKGDDAPGREHRLPDPERRHRLLELVGGVDEDRVD